MRTSSKWLSALAVVALCVPATLSRASIQYTGSISSPTDLVFGGGWTSGTLSWVVTDNMNGTWNYKYTFAHLPLDPETSHFTFEISTNVTTLDLFTNVDGNHEDYELGQGGGGSNPGIPGNFSNAIKFEFDDPGTAMVSFDVARDPTWGDFYAKGGSSSFAHNSGFVAGDANDPLSPPANGPLITNGLAHILVPDSVTPRLEDVVPEATSLMVWTMLSTACGLCARRRLFA